MVLCSDLDLMEFSEPEIFNYSTLLLSEKKDALYVGAREAIFELSKKNVTVKHNKVTQPHKQEWKESLYFSILKHKVFHFLPYSLCQLLFFCLLLFFFPLAPNLLTVRPLPKNS